MIASIMKITRDCIIIIYNYMTKEQLFKQYGISYEPELWDNKSVQTIQKWFKWFLVKDKGEEKRNRLIEWLRGFIS